MTGVSVVIPTKDRLRYLQQAIPMFLAQKEVQEVVVIVDGCQDGTLEYVREISANDERIRYADNIVNKGLPYSRNRGIELAKCDYVFTGEDDLELSDNFFSILLEHMQETSADIISGRNIFRGQYEGKAEAIARTDRIDEAPINPRTLMFHPDVNTNEDRVQPLLPAPMLIKAAILQQVRFDDSYQVNAWREESDFQLSAWSAGYKLVFCPHTISFNIVIENDQGGVHSTAGFSRVRWVIKNNWHFVRKHRRLIAEEFELGNLYVYIAKFAARRAFTEIVVPVLVETKQRWLAAVRGK